MKSLAGFILIFLWMANVLGQPVKVKNSTLPGDVAQQVIQELLNRPGFMLYHSREARGIHYAEACAGFGAARLAGLLKDTALLQKIAVRYAFQVTDTISNSANHVDVNVYGILPLELYLQGMGDEFLDQGMKLADGQWQDSMPDGLTCQTRFWIDDIWMIGSLQVQAYRVTGEARYIQRAAKEINAYIVKLQQSNGLFYHGFNGPFFWGRGNGWVAAGFAELLCELPESDPHYNAILEGYRKMMKTLLENQAEDGMWRQLIDNEESFKETSSTAMFGYAMTIGVKKGFLPKAQYTGAIDKAWKALTGYINPDGKLREVCVGTGQSTNVNFYLTRPRVAGDLHGQAPLLWFAYSLMANY